MKGAATINCRLTPGGWITFDWQKGKQFCWIMTFVESDQRSCETMPGEKKRSNVKCHASPWVTLPSPPHLIQLDTRNTLRPQWRSAVIYFRFDSSLCASQKFIYIVSIKSISICLSIYLSLCNLFMITVLKHSEYCLCITRRWQYWPWKGLSLLCTPPTTTTTTTCLHPPPPPPVLSYLY